jgi:hypothetical protein
MQIRTILLAVIGAFLAPFIYDTTAVSDVCAVPKDPRFGGSDTDYCTNSPELGVATCCWTEEDEEGIEIQYCQICEVNTETGEFGECGEVSQALKGPLKSNDITADKGGVFKEPDDTDSDDNVLSKSGGVFEEPTDDNNTFSRANISALD